jgi:TRAP-type C4-dicarboxylate transport system substrate-binding protein
MWENIKPARRYSIGYTEAVDGALHDEQLLDTSIGMLQNIYAQKQHTKFHFATVAPSFYTFFYTFILNRNAWDALNEAQQAGVMRAARAAEDLAFVNEQATAIYHRALNGSLGITMHEQTPGERAAWAAEFSDKVRNGILRNSDDPGALSLYIERIRDL